MDTTSDATGAPDLDCDRGRQLVSAAADGELQAGEQRRLTDHLASCAACRGFAEQVAVLTRQSRLRGVAPDPDFVARVMDRARTTRLGRGGWLRPALAWCGVVVMVQSARPLLLGELAGTTTHVARHVGASALALAVGLLYAAWKPHRAHGLLPLIGALLVTTLFGTLLDTLDGARRAGAEAVHIAELLGMALLWMVAGSPGWERLVAALRPRRGVAASTT
jgi:predicted anti-sigma-YlaC factor YlaD